MRSPGGQLLNYLQTNLSLLVGEIKLQYNKERDKDEYRVNRLCTSHFNRSLVNEDSLVNRSVHCTGKEDTSATVAHTQLHPSPTIVLFIPLSSISSLTHTQTEPACCSVHSYNCLPARLIINTENLR